MSVMDGRRVVEKCNGKKISALLQMANVSMENQGVICYFTAVVRWDCSLEKVSVAQFHRGKRNNCVGSVLEQNKNCKHPCCAISPTKHKTKNPTCFSVLLSLID